MAARAAARLAAYVETEVQILRSLDGALAPTVRASPVQLTGMLRNDRITFAELHSLEVIGLDGVELASARLDDAPRLRRGEPAVDEGLAGRVYRGPVRLSTDFTPEMTLGVPLAVAGEPVGAAVADIDLIGMWDAVAEVRVGTSGFARVLASDGTLIAHGDPEERRRVFSRERDPHFAAIQGAGAQGARYQDAQGREVVATAAPVPGLGWTVVVEQPVREAYAPARGMLVDVGIAVLLVALLSLGIGLLAGAAPVRALETMRAHAGEIARGHLDARVAVPGLEELASLARALNDMAAELGRLTDEIRARERLTTFARVAAGLAHDLRSPLDSVRDACAAVLRRPGDASDLAVLESVCTRDLGRLVRYVADLRRLAHEGRVPLELAAIEPGALAGRVLAEAAQAQKWSGIDFTVEGAAERIWADEALLSRALHNLVANAADACAERSSPGPLAGHVTVRLRDGETGDTLQIEVRDDGVGLAPARLREILAGDFKSSRRQTGFGLGLGIARHVATAHHGELLADSELGRGTTFTLRLPRQAAAGVSAADSSPELAKAGP